MDVSEEPTNLFLQETDKLRDTIDKWQQKIEDMPMEQIIETYYQAINVNSLAQISDNPNDSDEVKNKVKKILDEYGVYHFSPQTGGYGRSGIPDIICCADGKFIGIECKAGTNKPTALQEKNLRDIELADGISMVVNEDNIASVEETLQKL